MILKTSYPIPKKEMTSEEDMNTTMDQSGCLDLENNKAIAKPQKKAIEPIYILSDMFLYVIPMWTLLSLLSIVYVLILAKKK